jgi:phospholipid/cholesterol/gamma-HCH transport system substrate-binding protein
MKNQRRTEIKVGITLVLGILIFVWVFGWAKNLTIGSNRKEFNVLFNSVAGLEVGDPVTINGVRKGYVKDIRVSGNQVLTLLNMEMDISIKTDAKYVVMMLDLMGGKKVEITPGSSNKEIDYTQLQQGQFVGDIASAMAMLGSVQTDLVDVIKEVKISLAAVNKTLNDQQFNNDLKTSLSNLASLTNNLNTLIKNNSGDINRLLKTSNDLAGNVNSFIQLNRDTITQTLGSIQEVLKQSKELLKKVSSLVDQTNSSQNNLGKILNDPDLVNDIKETITHAKELTRILVEQLKAKGIEVNAHIF